MRPSRCPLRSAESPPAEFWLTLAWQCCCLIVVFDASFGSDHRVLTCALIICKLIVLRARAYACACECVCLCMCVCGKWLPFSTLLETKTAAKSIKRLICTTPAPNRAGSISFSNRLTLGVHLGHTKRGKALARRHASINHISWASPPMATPIANPWPGVCKISAKIPREEIRNKGFDVVPVTSSFLFIVLYQEKKSKEKRNKSNRCISTLTSYMVILQWHN